MAEHKKELSDYRLRQAEESLQVAKNCIENGFFKDSINRSYYAAFYAVKAVLALDEVDFKRHKDVVAHFNQYYVATGKFPREIGKRLSSLQKMRETSDYDDFYIASMAEASSQSETAELIINIVKEYLANQNL